MHGLARKGGHVQAAEFKGHMSFFCCSTVTCLFSIDSLLQMLPRAPRDGLIALARTPVKQCDYKSSFVYSAIVGT